MNEPIKIIRALYDDDDILMTAVKKVRAEHLYIKEIYTPFPVHGLDKAMGVAPTRLAICAFIYGILGTFLAILMTNYMMIVDWPQIIGGKPSFNYLENMPAFVPIIFELTVFCAAHLMVLTFFIRSGYYPGAEAGNPDPRTTDDKFLMEIYVSKDQIEIKRILQDTGAIEITEVKEN